MAEMTYVAMAVLNGKKTDYPIEKQEIKPKKKTFNVVLACCYEAAGANMQVWLELRFKDIQVYSEILVHKLYRRALVKDPPLGCYWTKKGQQYIEYTLCSSSCMHVQHWHCNTKHANCVENNRS